jgi:glycosyltransferase involved in cell wall biosynthesis
LTLVVPLSGNSARATEAVRRLVDPAEPVIFPLAQLADGGRRAVSRGCFERLVIVGAPPTDEVGYGLSALIALLGRPKQVALLDLDRERVVFQSLLLFLARSVPFAIGQAVASLAALTAQRLAIPVAAHGNVHHAHHPELRKLVYLRPVVGSASRVGGAVTHSHEVIRALRAEGIEVDAYTTGAAIADTAARDPEPPCRWHVVRTPRAVKAIPPSAAAGGDAALIRAALPAARTADAIYQRHTRFSLAGALLARLSGRPLFLEYNSSQQFAGRYWNPTPLQRRLAACESAVLKAAVRIFVVSDIARHSLVERGVDHERIIVNPNGVDAKRFTVDDGSSLRRRHGIGSDTVVMGFVGSFGPWHGAPVLARAFARIADQVSHTHLLLLGDGPELEATRGIVRDAGLTARTTVVGQVAPHEVPSYLGTCDILVSPHVPLPDGIAFFGSPTKLFEYMAAGKAIVASRLGQIADVLEHGETAWLVNPGDVEMLADALLLLADEPSLREKLGANARHHAIDRHSWQLNARRVVDAYAALAEREDHR